MNTDSQGSDKPDDNESRSKKKPKQRAFEFAIREPRPKQKRPHDIHPASLDALRQATKGKHQKHQIYACIKTAGLAGRIREEIAVATGIPLQSVCGVVKQLRDCGVVAELEARRRTRQGCDACILVAQEVLQNEK